MHIRCTSILIPQLTKVPRDWASGWELGGDNNTHSLHSDYRPPHAIVCKLRMNFCYLSTGLTAGGSANAAVGAGMRSCVEYVRGCPLVILMFTHFWISLF